MVVVAVAFVTVAQATQPSQPPQVKQHTGFIGGGVTHASREGNVGTDVDSNFGLRQNDQSWASPTCNTHVGQSNSGYLDQGTSAGGHVGSSGAGQFAVGTGLQKQEYGTQTSQNPPTIAPYGKQKQVIGGIGGQTMSQTGGTGGAAATQTGGLSELQNIQTTGTGGTQHQALVGTQGGMVAGTPNSYSSAGGVTGGGGIQWQRFGGIN